MKRITFFLTLVAPMLCLAQQPSTQPAIIKLWINQGSAIAYSVRLTMADRDMRLPRSDLRPYMPPGWAMTFQQAREKVAALRELVRSEPAMSLTDRRQRLAVVMDTLQSVEARIRAMQTLINNLPDTSKRLAERLQQLQGMEQNLQMKRAAMEARQEALQRGLRELQKRADEQRAEDPIVGEMQKILDLRTRQLDQLREQMTAGRATLADWNKAEADLAEARLRMLEHQATLGKAGKGELMDRLTDELAMVSIDFTEVQIQLDQLRQQIAANDPAKLTGAALDELLKREPGLDPAGASKPSPLLQELEKQAADLRLEWLKLVVEDVEIVEEPAAAQ